MLNRHKIAYITPKTQLSCHLCGTDPNDSLPTDFKMWYQTYVGLLNITDISYRYHIYVIFGLFDKLYLHM